ncbi:hypothetical protein Tco_0208181, partial [Tanacetum coccineum]
SKVASLEFERDSLADQLSRDELSSKRSSLESAFELFKGRMDAMQDKQATVLGNRVVELDAQLLGTSFEYLPALGGTIGCAINKGMQDGLKGRIDHGKAGRDLSVIEAYDPSTKAKYVDAMNALRTVDFSLLSVLKSKK